MNAPTNPSPDSPEAQDIETESLYGAAPDGSSQDVADEESTDQDFGRAAQQRDDRLSETDD